MAFKPRLKAASRLKLAPKLKLALAAIKGHALATAVVGTLLVGGSAATLALMTGTLHLPGSAGDQTGSNQDSTQRAQACANNGDAARLAAIYAPMFGDGKTGEARQDKAKTAQDYICGLFSTTGHRAFGLGDVQLLLATAATIERNGGNTGCLSGSLARGRHGHPGKAISPGHSGGAAIPSTSAAATEKLIDTIIAADAGGTPLAQLARNCGASQGAVRGA